MPAIWFELADHEEILCQARSEGRSPSEMLLEAWRLTRGLRAPEPQTLRYVIQLDPEPSSMQ